MSKIAKAAIAVLVAVFVGISLFGVVALFAFLLVDEVGIPMVQVVQKRDFNAYLSEKYGEDLADTFELVDYHSADIDIDYDFFEGFSALVREESACYRSPDRTFHVRYDREQEMFVDDYQYEDIEAYSVKYFSDLFGMQVAGVIYDFAITPHSGSVYPFSIVELLESNNTLWTEENFEEMLELCFTEYSDCVGVFIKNDFSEELYDDYLLKVSMQESLEERFPLGENTPRISLCMVNFEPVIERWSDYESTHNRYGYDITWFWLCSERYGYTPEFRYYADTDRLYSSGYAEKWHDDNPKEYTLDYGGEAFVGIYDYDIFNPLKKQKKSEDENQIINESSHLVEVE